MKIVMLDVDGVLNSHAYLYAQSKLGEPHDSREPGEASAIDPEPVKRLNRLVEATGAKVVVSSSWRHGRSVSRRANLLRSRGFSGEVIGKTPDSVPNPDPMSARHVGARGDEIHAWLEHAPLYGIESVESFVIIDDDDDMSIVADRLVRTDFDTGLTDAHVERAIEMLNATSTGMGGPLA